MKSCQQINKDAPSPPIRNQFSSIFFDTPRQKICKKEPGSHDDSIQNSLLYKFELLQSEQESLQVPTPPHLLSNFDQQITYGFDKDMMMDIEIVPPHKISNQKQNTDMLCSSDSHYKLPRKDQSDQKSLPIKSGSDTTMIHSYDLFHKMNQNKIQVIRHHQSELKNNKTPDFDFDQPLIQEFKPKQQNFKVIIVKDEKSINQRKALSTGRQEQQSQKRGKYNQTRKQLLTSFQKKMRKQRQREAQSEANIKKNDDFIHFHPQKHQCCSNNDIYSHHQYRAISPEFFGTSLSSCSEQLFVLSASDYKNTTAYLNHQQDTELTNNDEIRFRTASKLKISNTSVQNIQRAISIADNKFSPIQLNGQFYTPAKNNRDHKMEFSKQKHEEPNFFQIGKMKEEVSFQERRMEESRKNNQQTVRKEQKGISNFQNQQKIGQKILNKSFLRKQLERQANILKNYLMTQSEMKQQMDKYNSNKYCGQIKKIENLCNFQKLAVSTHEEKTFLSTQNRNRLASNQNNASYQNRTDRKNHKLQYTQREFAQMQYLRQKFNGEMYPQGQYTDQKVATEFIQKVDKNDVGKPMRQENLQNFQHQHSEPHVQRRLDFEGQNNQDESDAYHMQRYREQQYRDEPKKYYQPHIGNGHNAQSKHRQQNQYQGQVSPDNQPRGQNLDMRVAGIDSNGYRMSKAEQFTPPNNLNFETRVRNMHAPPNMPEDEMMDNMRTPPYMKHNRQRFEDPRTAGYSGMASFMTQTSSNQQNMTMKGQQVRPVGDFYQAISPFDTRFQNTSGNKNGFGCSRFMGRRATPHQQLHPMGYMDHRQHSQRKVMRTAINEQRHQQFSMTPASGVKQTTKNHLRASNSSGEGQEPQAGSMQVRPFEEQLMGQRRNSSFHERSGHKSGGDTPHHPSMQYRSHTPQRSRMMYQNSTPSYEDDQQDYDLIHDFSNHKMINPRDQHYRRMHQPSPSYGSFAPKMECEQEPQDLAQIEDEQANWSHKQFQECYENMQSQRALLKTCPMHGEESGYDEYKETMALMTAQAYAYAQSCYLFFQHMKNLAKTPEEKHHFEQQLLTANKMVSGLSAQQDMGIPGMSLPPPALVGVPPYHPSMFVDNEEMGQYEMAESTDSNMETVRTQTQNKNTDASQPLESQKKLKGFKIEEPEQNIVQKPSGIDNAPATKKDNIATIEHKIQKQVAANDCETPDNMKKIDSTPQMVTPFTAQVPHQEPQSQLKTENSEFKDNQDMQRGGIRYTQMPPPYQTPAPKVSNLGASGQQNRPQMQTQGRMDQPQFMGRQQTPFQMRGINGPYGQALPPFPNQMPNRMGLSYPPQFMHPQSMMSASEKRRRNRKCPKTTQFMMQEYIKDPSWCKETYQRVARITGLSDSQVYKWGWDQKNKKAEDGESDQTLKQNDDFKDSNDNETAAKTVQNAIACATISKSDFNFHEETQNGILLPHQMHRDEKKDDGLVAESPAVVLQNSTSENQITNKQDTSGKLTEATENKSKSLLQKRPLKNISHQQSSSLTIQKFKKKRDTKKFVDSGNVRKHNLENVDPSQQ